MGNGEMDNRFVSALTEAANRAEVTALFIRCGYYVYRPEADVNGEDLVVKMPDGRLVAVQMKGRATVNSAKYGNKNIWMLFPSAQYAPDTKRDWYFVPHDELFVWMNKKHGGTPKWNSEFHYPKLTKALLEYLKPNKVRPLTDFREKRFEWNAGDLAIISSDDACVAIPSPPGKEG